METFLHFSNNIEKYEDVYNHLSPKSKHVYAEILQYRMSYAILGEASRRLFKIPFSGKGYNLQEYMDMLENSKAQNNLYQYYDNDLCYYLDIFITHDQWEHNQYIYPGVFDPKEGSVIIDAGAYHGETAISFMKNMNRNGKIYSFEPNKDNFKSLTKNIITNKLTDKILAVNEGLWNIKTQLSIENLDAASCLIDQNATTNKVPAISIDQYCKENNLNKIDYLKLDVEGAEMQVSEGSSCMIKQCKPALAISLYHKGFDFTDIPIFIKQLVSEYNFYIVHQSDWWTETILLCSVKEKVFNL